MRNLLILFFFFFSLGIEAQLIYPVVGTYKGKAAQDMAIYGDNAYLMNDGGHCRVLNLVTGKIDREFDLACAAKSTHINNVCFGVENRPGVGEPAVYVSETNNQQRCFVEDLTRSEPILLQTIGAKEQGNVYKNHNWVVDRENKFIYGLNCHWHKSVDGAGNIKTVITKYRLPQISEGRNVTLSEKDILDRFEVLFLGSMQGSVIRKGKLYISTGMCEKEINNTETDRAIIVVDLKKKTAVKKINLNLVATNEPEGIDFYKNRCLVSFGQTGGIYRIKY